MAKSYISPVPELSNDDSLYDRLASTHSGKIIIDPEFEDMGNAQQCPGGDITLKYKDA